MGREGWIGTESEWGGGEREIYKYMNYYLHIRVGIPIRLFL